MNTDKEKTLDLQLNARGFESFAATGWLGNRPQRNTHFKSTNEARDSRDKRNETETRKRRTTIRIA